MRKLYHWLISLSLSLLVVGCGPPPVDTGPELKVIWEGNRFGYIDRSGNVVIPMQFDYAMELHEGLGGVNVGGHAPAGRLPIDGKWGFVDNTGRYVINPKYYSPPEAGSPYNRNELARVLHEGYIFSEGLAAVRTESEWIYIDSNDRTIIRNPRIQSARRFREGLANVFVNGLWGYIDREGNFVIEPQFLYPGDFEHGQTMVTQPSGRLLIIDRTGKPILPQYRIEEPFYDGITAVKPGFRGEKINSRADRAYTLVDSDGRFLFEAQFDEIGRFGNGVAPVLVGSLAGDPIAHPKPLTPLESPGGKWGFTDNKGNLVVNPVYEGARGFSEGIGAIKRGGLWAYVDEEMNLITDFEFRWVDHFEHGLAEVRLSPIHSDYDGHFAYINSIGEIIWVSPHFGE